MSKSGFFSGSATDDFEARTDINCRIDCLGYLNVSEPPTARSSARTDAWLVRCGDFCEEGNRGLGWREWPTTVMMTTWGFTAILSASKGGSEGLVVELLSEGLS